MDGIYFHIYIGLSVFFVGGGLWHGKYLAAVNLHGLGGGEAVGGVGGLFPLPFHSEITII